jgi:three-Cys-motif partner protein
MAASFCLIDQRTFECAWSTVETLSRFKKGTKIEIFYFFPSGWIDRALKATRDPDQIARWWGRSDWNTLQGMNTWTRAAMASRRFIDELGYGYAYPFPIYDPGRRRRLMYHMIHAGDHPEAAKLMNRAYRNATKPREPIEQLQEELQLLGGFGLRPIGAD